jgi:hypothetical protein
MSLAAGNISFPQQEKASSPLTRSNNKVLLTALNKTARGFHPGAVFEFIVPAEAEAEADNSRAPMR